MELTKEQKLLQTIVYKAWEDNTFKQELIRNPISTIQNLTSARIRVAEDKTVVVCDQTEVSVVYLNIPVQEKIENIELTEEQLEAIAAGTDPDPVFQRSRNPLDGISIE